jgi:hypothetical protein
LHPSHTKRTDRLAQDTFKAPVAPKISPKYSETTDGTLFLPPPNNRGPLVSAPAEPASTANTPHQDSSGSLFLARKIPVLSEFSAGIGPGKCLKARATSRVDALLSQGLKKKNRSLCLRQNKYQKSILAHRQTERIRLRCAGRFLKNLPSICMNTFPLTELSI